MKEFKKVDEKPVWLLQKRYTGGRIEMIGVYWLKETAERVAVSNLPSENDTFSLIMQETKLFGSMVVMS